MILTRFIGLSRFLNDALLKNSTNPANLDNLVKILVQDKQK